MPEAHPDPHRAEIAETLRTITPTTIEGVAVRPAELVLELGNSERYASHALTETGEDITGGSPCHWRILIPSRIDPHGLRAIEFGTTSEDMSGLNQNESRFAQELFLDETVDINEALNPAARQLYSRVGGLMVKATSEQAHKVFAALEVRYKPIDESRFIRWAHLFYSKALLDTHKYLGLRDRNNPLWLRQAVMPRHSTKTAEAMALSSLVAHRKIQKDPPK